MSDESIYYWVAIPFDGSCPIVFVVGEFDQRNIKELAARSKQLSGKTFLLTQAERAKFY